MEISNEDEKQIFAIARKNDAYDILISSYAPHVYGHEVIKEAILLLIVGSVTKKLKMDQLEEEILMFFSRRSRYCQIRNVKIRCKNCSKRVYILQEEVLLLLV